MTEMVVLFLLGATLLAGPLVGLAVGASLRGTGRSRARH